MITDRSFFGKGVEETIKSAAEKSTTWYDTACGVSGWPKIVGYVSEYLPPKNYFSIIQLPQKSKKKSPCIRTKAQRYFYGCATIQIVPGTRREEVDACTRSTAGLLLGFSLCCPRRYSQQLCELRDTPCCVELTETSTSTRWFFHAQYVPEQSSCTLDDQDKAYCAMGANQAEVHHPRLHLLFRARLVVASAKKSRRLLHIDRQLEPFEA